MRSIGSLDEMMIQGQVGTLRLLSNLLEKEIDTLENTPAALVNEVNQGRSINLSDELIILEVKMIRHALIRARGHQTEAAKQLGIRAGTLHEKIKRYKIDLSDIV